MGKQVHTAFLVLVLIQALHSIEEYQGALWDVLPPATFLCGLISDNLRTGFLVINVGLFVIGFLAWIGPVRRDLRIGRFIVVFWTILELSNGILHTGWAILERSYEPGLITAPLLFVTAAYLAKHMQAKPRLTATP